MLRKIIINPGERFGKLTVLKEVPSIDCNGFKIRMVLCSCDCSNEKSIRLQYLRSGHTKSCGCLRAYELLKTSKTHGKSKTKLHGVWSSMRSRCNNPNDSDFKNYGGRGIAVCEEWSDFVIFMKWALASGYSESLSIDRIDNDKGYCPSNCKFSSRIEQNNNKRNNVFIEFQGESLTATQWARKLGKKPKTIDSRIRLGWPISMVLGANSDRI